MALETDNLSIPNDQYASDTVDRLPTPWLAVDGDGNVLAFWSKKTQATPAREFALEVGASWPARRTVSGNRRQSWRGNPNSCPGGYHWPSVTMAWVRPLLLEGP